MIFFTTGKSAGYGARVFIQSPNNPHQVGRTGVAHDLAVNLSYWNGADKTVTILLRIARRHGRRLNALRVPTLVAR